jgi:hypothetical protein
MLLIATTIFQCCVSVHAPLETDKNYPPAWGDLTSLGDECKSLEGTYLNEGVIIASEAGPQPLLLTSVLNIPDDARTVSLSVHTSKLFRNGDALVTLHIVPEGRIEAHKELKGCYCIKGTLACFEVGKGGWWVPYFALVGSQQNVYFSMTNDRSLVAKLQNYHAGMILVVPVFRVKEPWAWFKRAGE